MSSPLNQIEIDPEARTHFMERVTKLLPVYMYIFDLEQMKAVYGNRSAWSFLGYEDEQTAPPNVVLQSIHPDDYADFTAYLNGLREIDDGEIREFEFRMRDADGRWRWMLCRDMAFERDSDGKVRQFIGASVDVTSRKTAADALHDLSQRNEALVRAIPDAMFLVSATDQIVDCHSPDQEVFAVLQGELLGKSINEVVPEELCMKYRHAARNALADGGIHAFEFAWEQEERPRAFEARVVRCGGDQVLVIARDITELKETTAALSRSEVVYRSLVESSHDLIWAFDAEGHWTFVNHDAVTRILGYRPDEVIGRPFSDFLSPEQFEKARIDYENVSSGEQRFHVEVELRRKDGTPVILEANAFLVRDTEGSIIGTTGTASDITARRQAEAALRESEARFRQFADGSDQVIWMAAPEGNQTLFVSRAFETIAGCPLDKRLPVNLLWQKIVHPDDMPRMQRILNDTTSGSHCGEFRIVRPDGTMRWLRSRSVPIFNESGDIYMRAGIAEDVTEQKRTEARLAQQQVELAHVSRLSTLGQMVAAIAHEVTQPLAAVCNYAAACQAALSDDRSAATAKTLVESIIKQTERAATIIQHLRNFTRRGRHERALCEIQLLIDDSIALLGMERHDELDIIYQCAEKLPRVIADRIQLQQVLVNLLKNAWEAGNEAGAAVNAVRVHAFSVSGQVVIEIRDSGDGVKQVNLQSLFQPFFTTKPQGLGMGLAICRTIVESHGGVIEAENSSDGGACFRIRLPSGE